MSSQPAVRRRAKAGGQQAGRLACRWDKCRACPRDWLRVKEHVQVRLQKILSGAGIASRRAAERLIAAGRVSVNGIVVRELGTRADPDGDRILVDGQPVRQMSRFRYLLLNKPRGYVSTRSDPEGRPTVLDLLRDVRDYVYPVGRLDYASEGLLILMNDGELAARLMHPRYEVEREYHVRVRGTPDAKAIARLARGVMIEGGRTAPADVRVLARGRGQQGDQAVLAITVREGRQHEVRHMCEAVGHPVVRLRRVRIGPLSDPELPTGVVRELTAMEVKALKRAAGIEARRPAGGGRGGVDSRQGAVDSQSTGGSRQSVDRQLTVDGRQSIVSQPSVVGSHAGRNRDRRVADGSHLAGRPAAEQEGKHQRDQMRSGRERGPARRGVRQ